MSRREREHGSFRVVVFGVALGAAGWLARGLPGTAVDAVWPWMVVAGAVLLLGVVVAQQRRGRTRTMLAGAGLVAFGIWFSSSVVPVSTPGRGYATTAIVLGSLLLVLPPAWWAYRQAGSAAAVTRWAFWRRQNQGVASVWAILRTCSPLAIRHKARTLRPSLREAALWRRWCVPLRELATPVARVNLLRIWSPVEDVTLRIGGPRTGKTGELAGRILDAPGPVIATSTRTDLVTLTGPVRARVGEVHVFNPSGLGSLSSTMTFNPLSGCTAAKVAVYRAEDLLSGVSAPGGDGDREFWSGQARRALAALLHAAALGEADMRDVQRWVSDPSAAEAEVTRHLRKSPEPAFELDAGQFLAMNERTRSSICATIMPALGWLTDATAAAAATGDGLDVAGLLGTSDTVYMLGAEDAHVAPLVAALTGHIAREARRIAAEQPDGRLDPPLTLALDEAALICPIPLDSWTADMGGRNVTIHIAAQSRAQLRQRWGDTGAAAILNNAATVLIYGGSRDGDDLQAYSTLAGEREEKVHTLDADDQHSTSTTRRVPVLSPAQIAQLKPRRVLIVRRGMAAAVGRVSMAWKRHDVKAEKRRRVYTRRRAQLQTAAARLADVRDHAGVVLAAYAAILDEQFEALRRRFAEWRATRRSRKTSGTVPPARRLGPAIEHIEPADIDGHEGSDRS